jgi:hypothetical protein
MRIVLALLLMPSMLRAADRVSLIRAPEGVLLLENDSVRVEVTPSAAGYAEAVFARAERWRLVLRGGALPRPEPWLFADGSRQQVRWTSVAVAESSATRIALRLQGAIGTHALSKTLTLRAGSPFLHVRVDDRIDSLAEVAALLSTYTFLPDGRGSEAGLPDFTWTPQLRPDADDVIADHTFRSPAVILQRGALAAALVPDVGLIIPWRSIQTAADLQVTSTDAPFLSYGAQNWRQRSHVFYTHSDKMTSQFYEGRFWYGYYLWVTARAPERSAFRSVVRFDWETWGAPNLVRGVSPQSAPFASLEEKAWRDYLPSVALDATIAGRRVTLLSQQRLAWSNKLPPAANTDAWFTVWFNALRTAWGAHRYAIAREDTALARRSEQVLVLALAAPRTHGLAPSVFYVDSTGGHWVPDQGWGGIDHGRNLSVFNNAWTGVWLLRWAEELPARAGEILRTARILGDALLRLQQPSGVLPSWIVPATGQPAPPLARENAETAGSALFLGELYRVTRERSYLRAAELAMTYIDREVIPRHRWYDFEAFFSCSRKPVGFFDTFTQQHAQNTLSLHQAAEASLVLYRVTGEARHLARGEMLLDYLSLYQQVWSPAWLSRPLYGGFGVQNTDGEWSDARQGYFAPTYMGYYDATHKREYFERGVAAARAMFSLFESATSPRTGENYAHSAWDRLGGVTGLHWGTGSSAVTLAILRDRYGDAYVDAEGGWGCGVNGCTVTGVSQTRDTLRVGIEDAVSVPRTVLLRIGGPAGRETNVIVNDRPCGRFAADALRTGITVTLGRD